VVGQLSRLGWACVSLVVWPIYYAAWAIKFAVRYAIPSMDRRIKYDQVLYDELKSPPFIRHFRGEPRRA
jgi:hypothetical protein